MYLLQSINNFSVLFSLFQLLKLFGNEISIISIISKSLRVQNFSFVLETWFIEVLFYVKHIKAIISSVIFIKINFHFLYISEEESTFHD